MHTILLILTGGTIGSVDNKGVIDVPDCATQSFCDISAGSVSCGVGAPISSCDISAGSASCGVGATVSSCDVSSGSASCDIESCVLTEKYYANNSTKDVVFKIRRPLNILSENMNPAYWNDIVMTIIRDSYDCDGVIIAHGSDTLTYTSAAMAWIFKGIDKPIVLTAANHPLEASNTNGVVNFCACVDYICNKANSKINGVYTIYQDNNSRVNVYNSATICEADGYLDEYHDQTGEAYGYMVDGMFIKNESYCPPILPYVIGNEQNLNPELIREQLMQGTRMMDNVLFIRPYPGMRYDNISFDNNKPACVLHWLYHAGTASTESYRESNSLLGFISRCKKEQIPVYIGSVKCSEESVYASHRELIDGGAKSLYDINQESAYAYLVLKYMG
ncbi:MAG: hypothetical protein E7265_10875 [Lachnospiraceae bacterium]|nr:hypothetical protein [Lachnospiraceae bacterium]